MSLAACISRCPSTTRWPWLANSLLPRNGSSTDACASFICRKQRILVVPAEEEQDECPRPHAPDAHDLPGRVDEPEALEQMPAIAEQRPPVLADHETLGLDRLLAAEELRDRDDQRRIAHDPRLAVDDARQLLERGQAVLGARLRDVALRPLDRLRAHLRGQAREDVLDIDARVPEIERPHRGEVGHRLTVGHG